MLTEFFISHLMDPFLTLGSEFISPGPSDHHPLRGSCQPGASAGNSFKGGMARLIQWTSRHVGCIFPLPVFVPGSSGKRSKIYIVS